MFDVSAIPLLDHHSHAGLYERRLGRHQTLADLDTADPHYASSAYRVLLREAYADLYGDPANWAEGVDAQYADGTEAAYTRMLERLGISTTLWDYRRLARDDWPTERYRLVYWIDPFVCPFPDPALSRGEELRAALSEALARGGLHRASGVIRRLPGVCRPDVPYGASGAGWTETVARLPSLAPVSGSVRARRS